MHRTESIDYGVVIEGEMALVQDDSWVLLKPGSVVVQRGTNHPWANRSGKPCRMLFILIDADAVAETFTFDPAACAAPLPRASRWLDRQAFLNHGRLMERAFNTPPVRK